MFSLYRREPLFSAISAIPFRGTFMKSGSYLPTSARQNFALSRQLLPGRSTAPGGKFPPAPFSSPRAKSMFNRVPYSASGTTLEMGHAWQNAQERPIKRHCSIPEWRDHMSFSVNTNTGAAVALQYLTQTQGSARPDPVPHQQRPEGLPMPVTMAPIFAIAQNQRGAVAGYAPSSTRSTTPPLRLTLPCLPASPSRTC